MVEKYRKDLTLTPFAYMLPYSLDTSIWRNWGLSVFLPLYGIPFSISMGGRWRKRM